MNENRIAELEKKIEELQRIIRSVSNDEKKYREMVESANSIIISVDKQERFTFINEYAERFFGYTKEELLGKKIVGTLVPHKESTGKNLEELVQKIIDNPEEFANNENENITKDGRRVWISWTNRGIYDSEGRLAGILGVGNDVTALKDMEKALSEGKAEWESIFDAISDWVSLIDLDRKVLRSNLAGERFLGLPMSEISGQSCCALIHGSQDTINDCPFKKMLKTGKREMIEVALKDESVWLQVIVDPVTDDDGMVTSAVHIVRDITIQKNIEKSLKESEERYRTVVDTAEEGVWVIDKEARTVFANRKMAQMLGYSVDEIKGRSLFEFMDDEMQKIAEINFEKRQKGIVEQHDFRFTRKDGGIFWAIISTNPLYDNDGNFTGALAMVTDITVRKQMADTIEASREKLRALAVHMESVREEERTRIAREIHDELGQALTCIKIDLSEIKNELETEQPDSVAAAGKTRAILNYIDETISTVRKISAELRPGVLDDLGIAAAIQWLSQDFQKRTGISCNLRRIESAEPDKNVATAFFRILQESLTNVARHSGATLVTIDFFPEDGNLVLSVRDNGKGFKEDTLDKSSSLGLLGIKERVLQFGGGADITSRPGKGTRVIVRIPEGKR